MSETPEMPPQPPRAGRGIRIALAVSLALNVAVAGLVGGALLGRGGPEDPPALRMLGLGPFALALPADGRDQLRGRLEEMTPDLRAERTRIGMSLRHVQGALLAEPFDRDAAARALYDVARAREVHMPISEHVYRVLYEDMSPRDAVRSLASGEPKPERL